MMFVMHVPTEVLPVEDMDGKKKARCGLCWFEHSKLVEHKTQRGALKHLQTQHAWWFEARQRMKL